MLLHGDEPGRTQDGNNNTYAQDTEIAWMDWDAASTSRWSSSPPPLARLRRDHPTFRRRRFFTGTTVRTGEGDRLNDIVWLHPDGRPMEDGDWTAAGAQSLGMYLNGARHPERDARGERDHRRPLPALLQRRRRAGHAHAAARGVRRGLGRRDRHRRRSGDAAARSNAGATVKLAGRSVLVLREHAVHRGAADASAAASVAASVGRSHGGRYARRGRLGTTRPVRDPGEHLPAPDHGATSTCTRRRAAAPLPARPRRRLGLPLAAAARPSPAATTGTTSSTPAGSTRPAAGPKGWPRCRPRRGGSGMGVLVDIVPNHIGVATPARTRGGGTCSQHGRASRVRRRVRHRLGRRRRADPAPGRSATTTTSWRRSRRRPREAEGG